jgi:hypothetical protein
MGKRFSEARVYLCEYRKVRHVSFIQVALYMLGW